MTSTPSAPALPSRLRDELVRALGPDAVLADPDRLLVYESDGLTRYRRRPLAVVLPSDTAACARAVALLHGAGVAVVPRGAGTGLSGGAVAAPDTVVLGTARMNRILELDVDARRARVGAGVVNAALGEAAREHGLVYLPDPSSQSACTLGGNVAENSGGPHCLKYGVTSRYVTGLTVVGSGGTVFELAGRGGRGLDLVGLFVGSEGCFGLATEIEVALAPAPAEVRTLLAAFPEIEEAGSAVTAILADGLVPAALEIVDAATIRAVEASVYAAGYPTDAGAALVVEFDGPGPGLDDELARAATLCRAAGATEIRLAADAEQRAALWAGRKKAFGAMGRLAPDLMVQDATVPRSRLPEVLRAVGRIAARHGLGVANVFHAGDGNLHPNLLFDRRDPDQVARVERASREIMEACVAAGGTITGEHGVGLDKREYMRLVHGPAELATMAAVRRVFDPRGGFNPGKVLPDEAGALEGTAAPESRRGREPRPAPAERVAELGIEVDARPDGVAVARPGSAEQVALALADACREGWRVRVSAGDGGADAADLVLSTRELRGIEAYEPADLTVTVAAGTPMAELARHLGADGLWLPIDGPGVGEASVGGVVATAGARALATAYGAVRDQVLGLTLVTGDGRVLELGGAVVKNVAGFDLARLIVGSRGALGVVTRVTLRTHPRFRCERYLSVSAPRPEALLPAVDGVLGAPLLPASIELAGGPDGAELLVRVVGSDVQVAHAEQVFTARMGPSVRGLEPEAGALRQRVLRAGAGGGARVLHARPSASGVEDLLARIRSAAAAAAPGAPRFWALPDQGAAWIAGPEGRSGSDPERSPAPEAVFDAAPGAAPRAGVASDGAPDAAVRALEAGLHAVFDPFGVLGGVAEPGDRS